MKNKRNRLILILVGFFLLIIPLFFFYFSLDNLYTFSKEKARESIRQKLLSTAKKIEEKLNPYNYLKSEFNKIHSVLLPDLPNDIVDGFPEDSFINNVYNESLFNKLNKLTIASFSPIITTVATNNFEKVYSYFSPELENELNKDNAKEELVKSKIFFDIRAINGFLGHYYNFYVPAPLYIHEMQYINYEKTCYNYLTRFNNYNRNLNTMYTDYFKNQTLYPIFRYTISRKGIHGYYSLLIPQSCIDPESIINSILSEKQDDIQIQFDESKGLLNFDETKDGFDYHLNLTTDFINQINAYKRLNNINKTHLKNNQFILSLKYPKDLINLNILKEIIYYCLYLAPIFYIFFSFAFMYTKSRFHLLITKKLICILSIIIILPIIGIGISTWLSANNINDLIEYNVSQTLNNELNKYNTINKENNMRLLSFILEMKRKIAQGMFRPEMDYLYNDILTKKDTDTWYNTWVSNIYIFSDNGNTYYFSDNGDKDLAKQDTNRAREQKYFTLFYLKFLNNLGLLKKSVTNQKNEITDTFSLGMLEQYITPELEESFIPQESIPQYDFMNFNDTNTAVYFIAKDKNKKNYFLLYRKYSTNRDPYKYIDKYTELVNPFWFLPSNEYADINLGIILNNYSEEKKAQWPPVFQTNRELNDLLKDTLVSKDSGYKKTKSSDETKIKQWIFTENDPYIIAGIANSKDKTDISFTISMIFPILLVYAIMLLTVITGFIADFINKPITIYKKALNELNNYNYGTTIKSFSKDEFNNITKAFNEMSIAIRQKELIKRYVSDKLIESVNANKIQNAGEGKIEKVTILSSDIRNFTGISEQNEPSAIVEMLNTYFTEMQHAISENGGIIDKYIGDAIQAVFYEESDKENPIIRAARAAINMRKNLDKYNTERKKSGLFTIENGIGIDTDTAITGTIGSKNGRKDFSVNGEVISRAAALEAKTKLTESKILISTKSLEEIVGINKTNHTPQQSPQLIFRNFDSESVELIDVRN